MFSRFFRQPLLWLGICFLLAAVAVLYPVYVIRPFRHQGPSELAVALFIMQIRPALVVVASAAAMVSVVVCWRQGCRRWQKIASVVCAAFVIVFAFLSRINIYELMFHPLERATFSQGAVSKLDGREEVIAVRMNGESRAYPVRSMSYHHIVNDVLGGQPIVATY